MGLEEEVLGPEEEEEEEGEDEVPKEELLTEEYEEVVRVYVEPELSVPDVSSEDPSPRSIGDTKKSDVPKSFSSSSSNSS